jgi:hypothetical protein
MRSGLVGSPVLLLGNKDKKSNKNCRSSRERLTTKNVIAIDVMEVSGSLVITRFRLNLRLACPNFPSIALRKHSSERACFFSSLLTFAWCAFPCAVRRRGVASAFGGLPNFGPLILIPLSLHQFLFSLVR